jgi:hypothetical protein
VVWGSTRLDIRPGITVYFLISCVKTDNCVYLYIVIHITVYVKHHPQTTITLKLKTAVHYILNVMYCANIPTSECDRI